MKCPNCSNENRDTAKFCDECGFPLTGMIAQAAMDDASLSSERTAKIEMPFDDELLEDTGEQPAMPVEEEPADEAASLFEDEKDISDEDFAFEEEPCEEDVADEEAFAEELDEFDDAMPSDVLRSAETPLDPSVTVDLSGLETSAFDDVYGERLVSGTYKAPENAFRDGSTMQMPRIEGEEPEKSKQFFASSTKKKEPMNKKPLFIVLGILAVVAAIAFVTYSMEIWGGKSVPNVVGMTQADAAGVLTEKGFMVRTTQVKSDDTEGLVLIMDPHAGARQQEGEEVVIHIATARMIPDIVGKNIDAAKAAIDAEGFTNVIYTTERSDEEEGMVLSVTPGTGERAKSATEIHIVSAVPFRVPDISDMYLDDAIQAVYDAGLNPVVIYVNSTSYPDGSIIGPDPVAGTVVRGGQDVYIQIAVERASKLEAATQSYLAPGNYVTIDYVTYYIESLDSYAYVGDNISSFSMTARPAVTVLGETIYGSARSVSGQIAWADDNATVLSIYL